MTPLFAPETDATPLANEMVSAVPKFTALPVLFETVGMKLPIVLAPLNVRLFVPVKPVIVFPAESFIVIVRLSPAPAVGVVVAAEIV
jgi:hypothetical protein